MQKKFSITFPSLETTDYIEVECNKYADNIMREIENNKGVLQTIKRNATQFYQLYQQ